MISNERLRQYNDVDGLNQRLSDISTNSSWLERLDITISYRVTRDIVDVLPDIASENSFRDADASSRIHDDFRREASFYKQAQEATIEALHKLQSKNVVTKRPDDYFAEMVKTDAHMQKIRRNLLEKQENIKAFEKAKKTQFAKKFGKKIEKEALLRKKVLRSEQSNNKRIKGNVLAMKTQKLEDKVTNNKFRSPRASSKKKKKDMKYGYGGKKRTTKRNSSISAADMSQFDSAMHSKPQKKRLNASSKRPGKSRRFRSAINVNS